MIISSSTNNKTLITIVSGIPRSGTSMMMAMLRAGGEVLLTDEVRLSDQHNPNGYFEFEQVKKLPKGDVDWLIQAQGKTVKVITSLLSYLPDKYNYQVILMRRNMNEILASQKEMLIIQGKDPDAISDIKLHQLYAKHLTQISTWMGQQKNIKYVEINYNLLVKDPVFLTNQIFDNTLNKKNMIAVIDSDLYRQRYTHD